MNRAERRRLAKHGDVCGVKPTITVNHYIHYYSLALADALHCMDFDNDTIMKVFDKVQTTVDCLVSGHIDVMDLQTMCEQEIGINFLRAISKE